MMPSGMSVLRSSPRSKFNLLAFQRQAMTYAFAEGTSTIFGESDPSGQTSLICIAVNFSPISAEGDRSQKYNCWQLSASCGRRRESTAGRLRGCGQSMDQTAPVVMPPTICLTASVKSRQRTGLTAWQTFEQMFRDWRVMLFLKRALTVAEVDPFLMLLEEWDYSSNALLVTCSCCQSSSPLSCSLSIVILTIDNRQIACSSSKSHIFLVQSLPNAKRAVLLLLQRGELGSHGHSQLLFHSRCHHLAGLVRALSFILEHDAVDPSLEQRPCLLLAPGRGHCCEFGEGGVVGLLRLERVSDQVGNPGRALPDSDLLEVFLGRLLPEDHLHLAEIAFLPVASAPRLVADSAVAFGEADDAAVDPEPGRIEALSFGVVEQVVKSSHHYLRHLSGGPFEAVDGVEDVSFLEEHQCILCPGLIILYFLMEVMIHLRWAEMVTLGMFSIGFGQSTQNSFLVYMGLGFAEEIPAFCRTLTKLLGFLPFAGMLGFNMATRGLPERAVVRLLRLVPVGWPRGLLRDPRGRIGSICLRRGPFGCGRAVASSMVINDNLTKAITTLTLSQQIIPFSFVLSIVYTVFWWVWMRLMIMEIDHKQKMQSRQAQCVSICSQLNLNPDKLRVQSLLASGTYRRLYNIVINDMSRSDLSFRKNLIKELYFLLQITPIIKPELKEHFLGEVQRWYNLNDHKKIDLASSKLNDLLSIVHHSRKDSARDGNERPKTGGTWNTNVNPFLRPYTASRARPASGKGSKIGQTTQADTNDICIREFTTNIQEELQMSEDFLQKHRTNHPDYEPSYEQLYHILKKVESQPQEQPPQIQQSYTSSIAKCGRYAKSAIPRRREVVIVTENPQSNPHIQAEQQCAENQEREGGSDSSSEEEELLYVSDKRQEPTHALRIQVPSPNAEGRPDELQKYLHCIDQKLVQAMREDREMASNYVGFARAKTAFRRELNRKSESRRLLSAKQNAREYRLKRPASALSGKENKQNLKGVVHDLTNDPMNVPADAPSQYPTYNRRDFLRAKYEQPVARFKKLNKVQQPGEKVRGKVKRPMTACVRFHSPVRFDPLSPDNATAYNAQVLQEIEKIKMRMGGKCSASTDSLMKALYVDSSPIDARWQDMSPFYGMVSRGRQKLKKKGRRPKSKAKLTSKS